MPELTDYMITNGVPENLLGLILMVPIAATIIAFLREIVGIKGFGIYTSLIIGFAFLGTGIVNGLIIFALILLAGTFTRLFIKHLRILYLPRMAIVLSGVAFAIFLMFVVAAFYKQTDFLSISLLPIVIMIILVENFIAAQIERGPQTAITLTVETLLLPIMTSFFICALSAMNTSVSIDIPAILNTTITMGRSSSPPPIALRTRL